MHCIMVNRKHEIKMENLKKNIPWIIGKKLLKNTRMSMDAEEEEIN